MKRFNIFDIIIFIKNLTKYVNIVYYTYLLQIKLILD